MVSSLLQRKCALKATSLISTAKPFLKPLVSLTSPVSDAARRLPSFSMKLLPFRNFHGTIPSWPSLTSSISMRHSFLSVFLSPNFLLLPPPTPCSLGISFLPTF